ncbi:fused MFS/spermidine synthase [Alphaproteobacteria bacterium LSUCC0396]
MTIQILLALTILISSACGLIIEIVAGRLLAPIFGMSLYTWTSIIAVVLAGLSIGHWIGGNMTRGEFVKRAQFIKIGNALFLSSFTSLLILLLLDHIPALVRSADLSVITAILLAAIILFFLPSLFVGIVSPIATKLAIDIQAKGESGVVIGRMYALGSAGAIFGALLAGYFLISMLGSRNTVILVAAIYFALGSIFFMLGYKNGAKIMIMPLAIGLSIMAGAQRLGALTSPCMTESNYFCIQIQDVGMTGAQTRLIALDHLVHSINEKDQPQRLHSPYVHFVDEYVSLRFGDLPPRSFFIGGGGFSLPRAWIEKYQGSADITIAEIDPKVTDVAKAELWFHPNGSRTKIIHGDARYELNNLANNVDYDLIFGDAFHDISIPEHLVTKEFNDLVASRLGDNGVYLVNVVDHAKQPLFLLSYVKTLQRSFDYVDVWFEPDPQQQGARTTFIVVGTNRPIEDDYINAETGFDRSWWRWPRKQLASASAARDLPILTDDRAPVDRLMSGLLLGAAD